MGGDGGTLNNSRQDHVRLRREIRFLSSVADSDTQRASVTECALSNEPLHPPHIVVDRAGQLYNKDTLISFLLERRQKENEAPAAFSHLRSLKYDTASVRCSPGSEKLICPVTLKEASEEGNFTVGWTCGCVTAPIRGVPGVTESNRKPHTNGEEECISCLKGGPRVPLGSTLKERLQAIQEAELSRPQQKSKKRKRVNQNFQKNKASRKVLNRS